MGQRVSNGRLIIAFMAAAALSACDGGSGTRTNELASSPSASLAVRVSPSQLQLSPIVATGCPVTQPFMTHFDLVLGPSSVDFFLDEVTIHFGDLNTAPLFFSKHDLERLFGTTHVPAGRPRAFTMQPEFGCGFSTQPRSLRVNVRMVDGRGQRHEATGTATIG